MSKLFTFLSLLCLLSYHAAAQIQLKNGAFISEKKIFVRLYHDNIDQIRQNENIKHSPEPFLLKSQSIKESDLTGKNYSLAQIQNIEKAEEPLFRTFIIPVPVGKNPLDYCLHLKSAYPNLVEIAEPYHLMQKMGSSPNDPNINKQNMLVNTKALEAWLLYDGDSKIAIGISDVGINQNHPDLKDNIAVNYDEIPNNGIDDDNNGYIDDYLGCNLAHQDDNEGWDNTYHGDQHGTEVAGIAAATYNNNVGIAGIGAKSKYFPIKVAIAGDNNLLYTYESIRYAALSGLDVLNCSWGAVKEYSAIDQSIIDFAVSKGVVIIASGGNASRPEVLDRNSTVFFPAGYDGVLGVGEVNNGDRSTTESMFGRHIRVVAPGQENYTTSNSSYAFMTEGSSYASPVVAGAAALAKGKHPSLNPNQIIEFVRQCTDDVSAKTPSAAKLIPGRINLEKVVTVDPMSFAGIRYEGKQYFNLSGEERTRIETGETYKLKLRTRNYLGGLTNARFVLSTAYDPQNAIEVVKDEIVIDQINATSYIGLNGFEFSVKNTSFNPVVMRVDIYADGDYHDFFKFDIVPTQNFITFMHKDIALSFGDRGEFGLTGNENTYGVGFVYKDKYKQMGYPGSGLLFTAGNTKASASFLGSFKTIQMWSDEDNTSIISDEFAGANLVGIEIKQKVSFFDDLDNVARLDITIYNKSGDNIAGPACGYYLDFDVNEDYDKNIAKLFFDAYPPELMGMENYAAELMKEDSPNMPLVAAAAYSKNSSAVAQAVGMGTLDVSTAPISEYVELLNSGVNKQVTGLDDRAMLIGMRFNQTLEDQDSVQFTIIIAAAETESQLASDMKKAALKLTSVSEKPKSELTIYPNPVVDKINIQTEKIIESVQISDIEGNVVFSVDQINANEYSIDTQSYVSGTYFMTITGIGFSSTEKLIIAK